MRCRKKYHIVCVESVKCLAAILMFGVLCFPAEAKTKYTYDKLNRIQTVTYDDGTQISYSYDANGNIKKILTEKISNEKKEQEQDPDGDIDKESEKEEDKDKETEKDMDKESEKDKDKETENEDEKDKGTGKDKEKEVEKDKETEKEKELEKENDKETEKKDDEKSGQKQHSGQEINQEQGRTNGEKETTAPTKSQIKKKENRAGTKIKWKGGIYVIQKTGKNRCVRFLKLKNKKASSFSMPNAVISGGYTYPVREISDKAFQMNKKLKKITIGKYVERIGSSAFLGDKNLRKIVIKSKKLRAVGKKAWKGIYKKAVIKVPKSRMKKYRKIFKNKGQGRYVKITK